MFCIQHLCQVHDQGCGEHNEKISISEHYTANLYVSPILYSDCINSLLRYRPIGAGAGRGARRG